MEKNNIKKITPELGVILIIYQIVYLILFFSYDFVR